MVASRGRSRTISGCVAAVATGLALLASPLPAEAGKAHLTAIAKSQLADQAGAFAAQDAVHQQKASREMKTDTFWNIPKPRECSPTKPAAPKVNYCKLTTVTAVEDSTVTSGSTTDGLAAGYHFKLSAASQLWDLLVHNIVINVDQANVTFTGTCSNGQPASQTVVLPDATYKDITRTYGRNNFCPSNGQSLWTVFQSQMVPVDVEACGAGNTVHWTSSTFNGYFISNLPLVGISQLEYHTFADHLAAPTHPTKQGTCYHPCIFGDFIANTAGCVLPPVGPPTTSAPATTECPTTSYNPPIRGGGAGGGFDANSGSN